ncbi:MAG: NAD-dependent epimerase/dehydratase family protein [Candidatus Altiarchaeota archaeon]|nr:NAD-dependent epimerase/dehydratase family protein [Candidatus Altiarchaeota archaeon]
MNWKGKEVLVTGGAGFIGSHLVKKLLDMGCNVYVADNFSRGREENIKSFLDRIQVYPVDLTRLENCMLATKDIDYVFHLAASVGGIHYIKKENVECSTSSILMNTNMLEAAVKNDIERFLFASSACVYREESSDLNRFKEEDAFPANPPTTYGWAKIMGEIQCRSYYLDYGIKTSSVRIFNCYGENESIDPKWSHVIPSLIRKAILYPREKFSVFGDGKQERAFLYVGDCVDGFISTMEKITDGDAINLGSEEVISIGKLAEKIIELVCKDINIQYDLSGPQGTHMYCANTIKMKEILSWVPRIPLDEGLGRTYQWIREELNVER